ncbi:hypothetical protein Dimus_036775, partial [Dionaea muscipula]
LPPCSISPPPCSRVEWQKKKNWSSLEVLLLVLSTATARDAAGREMKVRGREEARREMKVTGRANNSPTERCRLRLQSKIGERVSHRRREKRKIVDFGEQNRESEPTVGGADSVARLRP